MPCNYLYTCFIVLTNLFYFTFQYRYLNFVNQDIMFYKWFCKTFLMNKPSIIIIIIIVIQGQAGHSKLKPSSLMIKLKSLDTFRSLIRLDTTQRGSHTVHPYLPHLFLHLLSKQSWLLMATLLSTLLSNVSPFNFTFPFGINFTTLLY